MISIFFKTYGCQANVADSEGLIKYLETIGCVKVEDEAQADMLVVNTCAIREKAEQKMFSYLGSLAEFKKIKPYLKIGVIGCVASYKKQEIYTRFDHVSFVFGAREDIGAFQQYLFDVVTKLETTKQLYLEAPERPRDFGGQDRDVKGIVAKKVQAQQQSLEQAPAESQSEPVQESVLSSLGGIRQGKTHFRQSFINITSGCNNYCTYCIVPFTRGKEKSYSLDVLVERAFKDIQSGVKEINLIGQNVNSYTCPDTGRSFAHLLEEIAKLEGEFWVRYVSPHPKDMTVDVLETMARYKEKLCGWVHFPLQAGSNKILKAMNRTYTLEHYLEQINAIRSYLPHATISTDIIVGFPDETEEDYEETRKAMELVKFDFMFSFIYSRRKYTKAFNMGDTVVEEVKQDRLEKLQARQKEICYERNKVNVGKIIKILVEKRLSPGKLLARTEGNIRVLLDGSDDLINTFAHFYVEKAGVVNLEGSLVPSKIDIIRENNSVAA